MNYQGEIEIVLITCDIPSPSVAAIEKLAHLFTFNY